MLNLTSQARSYLTHNIHNNAAIGVHVKITSGGCAGWQYAFSHIKTLAELQGPYEMVDCDDFKIFIDSSALLFIIGTTLDIEHKNAGQRLVFNNPNEKRRCGCGKSFG
jgi:iron-sulfur cluster assembly protein